MNELQFLVIEKMAVTSYHVCAYEVNSHGYCFKTCRLFSERKVEMMHSWSKDRGW